MKLFSDTIDINKDFTVDYYAPCNSCEIEFYCEGPFPPYSLKFKSIYDVDCNRIFEEEIQQKNRECMKNGAIFIPYFYVQIINCLRKFKIGNDLTQSLSYKKLYETIYDMIFSDKENPLINFETLSDDVKYVLLNQKILNNSEYEESKKNYLYKENFSKEDLEKNVYQMITIIKKIYDKAYYEQYKENNIKNEIKMPGFGLRLSAGFFFTWVSYQLFKYH